MKRFLRGSWRYLSLALGAGVLAFLVAKLGAGTIVTCFERIGPAFLLMPAVAIVGLCVRGLSILPLMPAGERMRFHAAITSRLAATALNILIPALGVGGEAIRLLWVPPGQRDPAVAAIILDRSLLIVADVVFLLTAIVAGIAGLTLPRKLEWIAIGSAAGACVFAAIIVWITAKRGVSVPFVKALRSVGFKSMKGKVPDAEAVDSTMRALWHDRPRCVLEATTIQFVSRLFLAAEIWMGLWLLRVPATPLKALVIAATPIGVNALFTFIPGQLGVQEAGIGLVFGALRLGARQGWILGILQRISQLVQVPVGLIALATAPSHRGKSG